MPKVNYYIVDKISGSKVEGPYGKKKCQRVLEKTGSLNDFYIVKEENVDDLAEILGALEGLAESVFLEKHPSKKPKKKGTRRKKEEDREKETKYLYRTGYFDEMADVKALMKKLDITDYSVQKDSKGYFAVYNDPVDS